MRATIGNSNLAECLYDYRSQRYKQETALPGSEVKEVNFVGKAVLNVERSKAGQKEAS